MSTITLGFTDTPGFPEGSVVDHIRLDVVGLVTPATSQAVAVGVTGVEYTFAVPDTYTVTVSAISPAGTVYGTAVSTVFVREPVLVTLSIPSTVTVA